MIQHPLLAGQTPSMPTTVIVTITGINTETSRVMCLDAYGQEFEIDASLRPKGSGFPMPGEQWVMSKWGAQRALVAQAGAPGPPEVTGSRLGMHPIAEQMLNALSRHGLVIDQSDATQTELAVTDANDPLPTPDPEEVYDEPDTVADPETPAQVPADENGPKDEPKGGGGKDGGKGGGKGGGKEPEREWYGWEPLYLGTYNLFNGVGPQRAKMDLHRLHRSKMQVVGLQEMAAYPRRGVLNDMENWGWEVYQDRSSYPRSQNPIAWRKAQFRKINAGTVILSPNLQTPGDPIISLCWVKLEHKASGRIFYFANTHLSSKIEGRVSWSEHIELHGRPSTRPDLQQRLRYNYSNIKEIKAWVRHRARNVPVFLSGDFNIDAYDDRRHRTPNFPYRQWREIGMRSNWDLIDRKTAYATHSSRRWIDQIWAARTTHHQVRLRQNWIFTGYHSDHRPVMVKAMIRSKKKPRRK